MRRFIQEIQELREKVGEALSIAYSFEDRITLLEEKIRELEKEAEKRAER